MSDLLPMSRADLRQTIRDARYSRTGHPEQAAYQSWVGDAFRAFDGEGGEQAADGLVWVRPYTRTRDGESQHVAGHYRHAGGGGDHAEAVGNRITVRDADGDLLGRCERNDDGTQFCTLAMPDGGLITQGIASEDGEFTPINAPAAAVYGFDAMLGAATALYGYLNRRSLTAPPGQAAPDVPFLLFYQGFEGTDPTARVTVGTLPPGRVEQFCPKTAEFEERLARITSATPREGLSAQQWGTAIHRTMHHDVGRSYDARLNVVRSELSVLADRVSSYGAPGSTRLDILHHVEGTDTICVYDVKTGETGLGAAQAGRLYLAGRAFANERGVVNPRILVIQLRTPR